MPTKKKKQQVDPAEQFVRQIRQYLDQSGQLNEQGLSSLGQKNTDPIMNLLLNKGYGVSKGHDWLSEETDAQAKDYALQSLRDGLDPYAPSARKNLLTQTSDSSGIVGGRPRKFQHHTASENLADALYSNALQSGLSPELATQAVQKELDTSKTALGFTLQQQHLGNTTLPVDVQKALLAKSAGAGANGGQTGAPLSLADQMNQAAATQLDQYYSRGKGDIAQYVNNANELGKGIPSALAPSFLGQEMQLAQAMQVNLDNYKNRQLGFPEQYALEQDAKDYIKGPNTKNTGFSSLGSLNQPRGIGGMMPIHPGGPSGMDFGRLIQEAMKWSQNMGSGLSSFERQVSNPGVLASLQHMVPKNKNEYKALPSFLSGMNNNGG